MIDYSEWPESRILQEKAESEKMWRQMASQHPEFTREYDPTGDFHMVRQLVLENRVGFRPFAGSRCMDLGANVGTWASFCALNGADVTAYEPDPHTFSVLSAMLERTKLKMNAVNAAVWTYTGTCPFYGFKHEEPVLFRHNGHIDNGGDKNHALQHSCVVPCVSFDDAIGDTDWDCLKIDVEGAEFQMILQASDTTLRHIQYAYIEFHPWAEQKIYEETIHRIETVFNFKGTWSSQLNRWEDGWISKK